MEEPEKKRKGPSGGLTILIAIVVIVRIVMIIGRKNNGGSGSPGWDSTYLIWSIFFLVVIVGSYFWYNRKGGDS